MLSMFQKTLFFAYLSMGALGCRVHTSTYDYIVVGGGLSGLVVANRLSEDSEYTVLVVESGYAHDDVTTQVPSFANSLNFPLLRNITSVPDPYLNNATFPVWVGDVVGGGSVVNGMAFNRGSAADYNAWEALGNVGWNWSTLLPYFKKSTTFTPPQPVHMAEFGITYDASFYGTSGPVQASFPRFEYQDTKVAWSAFKSEGLPLPIDHGSGDAVGAYWTPTALIPGSQTRSHSRNAYYDPIKGRENLRLITGQTVQEVLLARSSSGVYVATGVKYISRIDGTVIIANARKEVILAAGAIFTPQVLQLSGLGPRAILNAAGVIVKKDVPGIGANLQDHPNANLFFNLSRLSTPNPQDLIVDPELNASTWQEYQATRDGPHTQAHGSTLAFLSLETLTNKSMSIVNSLRSQSALSFLPSIYSNEQLLTGFKLQRAVLIDLLLSTKVAVGEVPIVPFGLATSILQHPLSRGSVSLNPDDKYGNPLVQFNALQNPVDKQIIIEMVRWTRRHWSQPDLAVWRPLETKPGVLAQTDDEIIESLLASNSLTASFAHMSGSCSMLPEGLGGVVDHNLKVYGVEQLRIVDASIIPLIPATHLQATIYAIAEKAADLIKGEM